MAVQPSLQFVESMVWMSEQLFIEQIRGEGFCWGEEGEERDLVSKR